MAEPREQLLKATLEFGGLEDAVLKQLAGQLERHDVVADRPVLREGEATHHMVFIGQGAAFVRKRNGLGVVDE